MTVPSRLRVVRSRHQAAFSELLSNVAAAMQIVELHAGHWITAADFANAPKKIASALDWHGSSANAFLLSR